MKKIAMLGILIFSFLSFTCANVYAADFPTGDFKLDKGRLRPVDLTEDAPPFYMYFFQTIHIADINISGDKLTANAAVPVNFARKSMNEEYKGTGNISMEGTYDKEIGSVSGTFKYIENAQYLKSMIDWDGRVLVSTGDSVWQGKFRGNLVGERAVIIFSGVYSGNGKDEMADGSFKDYSAEFKSTIKTIFDVNLPRQPGVMKDDMVDLEIQDKGKDSGARFSGFKGQIEIKMADEPADYWEAVEIETKIPYGAMIRTKDDSTAVISFPDMSTFTMKPGTTVVINGSQGPESKLDLVAGRIWTNVKLMVKDGSMEVDMFQAVAGIKGTVFECIDENGISTLKVYQGVVTFTAKADNKTIEVNEGEMVSADATGLKEKQTFDSAAELKPWKDIIIALEPEEEKNVKGPDEVTTEQPTPNPQTTGSQPTGEQTASESGLNPYVLPGGIGAVVVLIIVVVIAVIKKKA